MGINEGATFLEGAYDKTLTTVKKVKESINLGTAYTNPVAAIDASIWIVKSAMKTEAIERFLLLGELGICRYIQRRDRGILLFSVDLQAIS